MEIVKEFFRKNGKYFMIGYGIIVVAYFIMIFNHKQLPYAQNLELRILFRLILAVFGLPLFPIIFISNIKSNFKIVCLVFMTMFCSCLGLISISGRTYILDSLTFHDNGYLLIMETSITGYTDTTCYLHECEENFTHCKRIDASYHPECNYYDANVMFDYVNDEILIFYWYTASNNLVLSYDDTLTEYNSEGFGKHQYYLTYAIDESEKTDKTLMLYHCEGDSYFCDQLPFQYTTHSTSLQMEWDEETGAMSITDGDTLIYTYDGETGTCHVDACSLTD